MRPRGRRDLGHQALYLFGAACPARDEAVALVLPDVSTAAMQALLDELAKAVDKDAHAVVIMDRAGWHCAKALTVPDNISLALLPPYSPELNVIERIWLYLRKRYLSPWSACSRAGRIRRVTPFRAKSDHMRSQLTLYLFVSPHFLIDQMSIFDRKKLFCNGL